AKAAHRRLIRYRPATQADANKTPHRLRIVKRLFHRRIEPVLQEIDAQHALDADRRRHYRAADKTARSACTAPGRGPRAPSPQEPLPAASSWHSGQIPQSQASTASPPSPCAPIRPTKYFTAIVAAGFCRGSLRKLCISQQQRSWYNFVGVD